MKQPGRISSVWFVRVLVIFGLCLPVWLLPGTALAGGNGAPVRETRTVDFFAAVESGQLSYVARGRGVASGPMVELSMTNLTQDTLNVILPPASRFVPSDGAALPGLRPVGFAASSGSLLAQGGGSQGGTGGYRFAELNGSSYSPLANGMLLGPMSAGVNLPGGLLARPARQAGATRTVYIEAYCANAHLDNPSPDTLYTILPPEDSDLTRLIQAAQQQTPPISAIAMQIAIWTVTDDVDMDFLREVGYEPNDAELRQALLLLQAAGIDLSGRNMGQVEMPPAPPAPGEFTPGQTKAIQVRGSVVGEDGNPIDGALVFLAINGPERSELRLDVSSGRGRFDAVINLYGDDTVDLIVFELGQEAGRLRFSASELAELFDGGAEIVITLRRGLLPPPLPTPDAGFGSSPVMLFGVRQIPGGGRVRSEPSTASDILGTLGCAERVVPIDAQTTGADGLLWYHLAEGGWMRHDTLSVFESRSAADGALSSTSCAAPSPTQAPAVQQPAAQPPQGDSAQPQPQTGGEPQQPPSGGEPTVIPPTQPPAQTYNVTIQNQTSCDASVSFGPFGGTIGAGGSASVSVSAGTYGLSANAGSCGSLNASYLIDADATITLSN